MYVLNCISYMVTLSASIALRISETISCLDRFDLFKSYLVQSRKLITKIVKRYGILRVDINCKYVLESLKILCLFNILYSEMEPIFILTLYRSY